MIKRLVAALPAPERRLNEPDPANLFAPSSVPPTASGTLRTATFNLLNDERVYLNMGGAHALWDLRRVNALRTLVALDADVVLLQELQAAKDLTHLGGPKAGPHGKSIEFIQKTLGPTHTLVVQGDVGDKTKDGGRNTHD